MLKWILPIILTSAGFCIEESDYSKLARADHPITEQKQFVVVVCSYKNICYYEKNLNSILSQDYDNYRVIYVDDASPDGTGHAVERYLNHHSEGRRVDLRKNAVRQLAMANQYQAIHTCAQMRLLSC